MTEPSKSKSHILTNIPATSARSNATVHLKERSSNTSHHQQREVSKSNIAHHNPALAKGEHHSGHVGGYHTGHCEGAEDLDPVVSDSQEEVRRRGHAASHHSHHDDHHPSHENASHHSHLVSPSSRHSNQLANGSPVHSHVSTHHEADPASSHHPVNEQSHRSGYSAAAGSHTGAEALHHSCPSMGRSSHQEPPTSRHSYHPEIPSVDINPAAETSKHSHHVDSVLHDRHGSHAAHAVLSESACHSHQNPEVLPINSHHSKPVREPTDHVPTAGYSVLSVGDDLQSAQHGFSGHDGTSLGSLSSHQKPSHGSTHSLGKAESHMLTNLGVVALSQHSHQKQSHAEHADLPSKVSVHSSGKKEPHALSEAVAAEPSQHSQKGPEPSPSMSRTTKVAEKVSKRPSQESNESSKRKRVTNVSHPAMSSGYAEARNSSPPTRGLAKGPNPTYSVRNSEIAANRVESTISSNVSNHSESSGDLPSAMAVPKIAEGPPRAIPIIIHPADHSLTPEDMKHLSDVHSYIPVAGRLLPPPHHTGHSTHHSKRHHREHVPKEDKTTQTYRDLSDTDDDMIKPDEDTVGLKRLTSSKSALKHSVTKDMHPSQISLLDKSLVISANPVTVKGVRNSNISAVSSKFGISANPVPVKNWQDSTTSGLSLQDETKLRIALDTKELTQSVVKSDDYKSRTLVKSWSKPDPHAGQGQLGDNAGSERTAITSEKTNSRNGLRVGADNGDTNKDGSGSSGTASDQDTEDSDEDVRSLWKRPIMFNKYTSISGAHIDTDDFEPTDGTENSITDFDRMFHQNQADRRYGGSLHRKKETFEEAADDRSSQDGRHGRQSSKERRRRSSSYRDGRRQEGSDDSVEGMKRPSDDELKHSEQHTRNSSDETRRTDDWAKKGRRSSSRGRIGTPGKRLSRRQEMADRRDSPSRLPGGVRDSLNADPCGQFYEKPIDHVRQPQQRSDGVEYTGKHVAESAYECRQPPKNTLLVESCRSEAEEPPRSPLRDRAPIRQSRRLSSSRGESALCSPPDQVENRRNIQRLDVCEDSTDQRRSRCLQLLSDKEHSPECLQQKDETQMGQTSRSQNLKTKIKASCSIEMPDPCREMSKKVLQRLLIPVDPDIFDCTKPVVPVSDRRNSDRTTRVQQRALLQGVSCKDNAQVENQIYTDGKSRRSSVRVAVNLQKPPSSRPQLTRNCLKISEPLVRHAGHVSVDATTRESADRRTLQLEQPVIDRAESRRRRTSSPEADETLNSSFLADHRQSVKQRYPGNEPGYSSAQPNLVPDIPPRNADTSKRRSSKSEKREVSPLPLNSYEQSQNPRVSLEVKQFSDRFDSHTEYHVRQGRVSQMKSKPRPSDPRLEEPGNTESQSDRLLGQAAVQKKQQSSRPAKVEPLEQMPVRREPTWAKSKQTKHIVHSHHYKPKNVVMVRKSTQISSDKLGYTSAHDMVKHDGRHLKLTTLTPIDNKRKSLAAPDLPLLMKRERESRQDRPRSRSAPRPSSSDDNSDRKSREGRRSTQKKRENFRTRGSSVDSTEEGRRFLCAPITQEVLVESRSTRSARTRRKSRDIVQSDQAGCGASFSPVENFSDLPSNSLCDGSILHPIPLHLQIYQRDYCYDSSQLRYLITNVLKRLEKRHMRRVKLVCDIQWAKEENRHQRNITENFTPVHKENVANFEQLQQRQKCLEAFTSDRRIDEFDRRIHTMQDKLAQNITKKQRLIENKSQCMDQTVNFFQKSFQNVDDQWMEELTFLRGENAVLDAEYYRTQAAIRQTETELTASTERMRTAPNKRDLDSVASHEDVLPAPDHVLHEARRDRALYYDQVLALRAQCNKALNARTHRISQHFRQFSQQMAGISRGLQQVLKNFSRVCDSSQSVLAHPVVNCFVLACRPMYMEVVEETVSLAQEEYRKFVESLKRYKSTTAQQTDQALHNARDYDVEVSLLPRFRRQVTERVTDDTDGCSTPL